MIVRGDPRAIAMHQTGGLLELIAPVRDLPVSMFFAKWLFRFFHQDVESISVLLDSGLVTCLANKIWWESWWASSSPSLKKPYFLSLSWILISIMKSCLTCWRIRDNEARHPVASYLSPPQAEMQLTADASGSPAETRRTIQLNPAPNANLQNCELSKWLLFLTTKCLGDLLCRNS